MGYTPNINTPKQAGYAAQAIVGIMKVEMFDKAALFALLKRCIEISKGTPDASFVRRGICRLDELLFSDAAS